MSNNNLRLQVVLGAVDKLTRPFRSAQSSSKELASAIKKSREQLKTLNEQASRVDGFRKASSQLAVTGNNLKAAREEAAKLARQFADTNRPTAQQAKLLAQAKNRVNELQQTYNGLRQSIQRQRQALGGAGIDTKKLSDAQRRLKTDTESATRTLARQQEQLKTLGERQAKMNAVRDKYHASNQQRAMIAGLGFTSAATGRAMFNGLKQTLHVGYDFDAMMSKTQAVTRIQDKNDPAMTALRQQARTLPLQSKFTDLQVAEGQYFLGRTGYSAKQIQGAMPGMLNLAAAGDIDLGTTADIASNIQTAMGIPAEKMDHVADVLTALFTRNNVDIPMLGESLKYSAGVGREYGQSLETISAATAMLGSAGIQGSQAGTTMRSILSRIGTSKAVADLGVNTKDRAGNMRDMVDILRDINKKTAGMGNVERGQIFKNIAGQYAVTGFGVLMHAAGDGSLEKMRGAPGEYDGEAARVSKTMLDNMAGDMTMLHAALENISVELFEKNNGWLRDLTKSIGGVLHGVAEFLKAHPQVSKAIVIIGAAVAGATVLFGGLMFAVVGLLAPITLLRFQLSMLGLKSLPSLTAAVSRTGSALSWLAGAPLSLLRRGMASSGSSAGLLSAPLNSLRRSAGLAGNALKAVAGAPLAMLRAGMSGIRNVIGMVMNPLATLRGGLSAAGGVLRFLVSGPLALLRVALYGISGLLGALLSPIGLVVAALAGVALVVWKYWQPISAFLGGVVEGFKAAAAPISAAFEPLRPVFQWIGDKVQALWGWFTDLLTPVKSTSEELNSAAAMGRRFGEALAEGLNMVMHPLESLKSGVSWLLEKLGIVSKEAAKAKLPEQVTRQQPATVNSDGKVVLPPGGFPSMGFAGMYDSGGTIPRGQFGIVGENGPEIVNGPANVTSRRRTAALASVVAGVMGVAAAPAEAAPLHPYSLPAMAYKQSQPAKSASVPPVIRYEINAPIHITAQPGQSAQDIAREVARQLDARERKARAKARSNFSDQGGYES
ncbi:phage tail tape measure protein [Klebsiella variicola]|nr:phage tail tape measure protein [Enterobacter roggenkampii]GKJ44175.1 phage tail tape measure protein [Klebsiella variicola]